MKAWRWEVIGSEGIWMEGWGSNMKSMDKNIKKVGWGCNKRRRDRRLKGEGVTGRVRIGI